jgi:dipeptide/tripeptide permease
VLDVTLIQLYGYHVSFLGLTAIGMAATTLLFIVVPETLGCVQQVKKNRRNMKKAAIN